jgi:hypothetical protein
MTPTRLGAVCVVNTTPHVIRFAVEDAVVEIPPCGILIDAQVEHETVRERDGIAYLRTSYRPSQRGLELLASLERESPRVIIVGSVIAAQAYPGRVVSLVAVPGLERVPVDQKLCRSDAFGTFE